MADKKKSTRTPEIRAYYESIDSPTEVTIWAKTADGLHYITDGHFVVRMPATEEWDRERAVGRHDVEMLQKFFWTTIPETSLGSFIVPEIETPVPEVAACENCGGSACCNCQHCDTDHECGLCDGTGRATLWPKTSPVIIAGCLPALSLRNLGAAVHFAPSPCEIRNQPAEDEHSLHGVYFLAEGFAAAAMPLQLRGEDDARLGAWDLAE